MEPSPRKRHKPERPALPFHLRTMWPFAAQRLRGWEQAQKRIPSLLCEKAKQRTLRLINCVNQNYAVIRLVLQDSVPLQFKHPGDRHIVEPTELQLGTGPCSSQSYQPLFQGIAFEWGEEVPAYIARLVEECELCSTREVFVEGAGFGRLCSQLVAKGFSVQYYQSNLFFSSIASFFLSQPHYELEVFPHIHSPHNQPRWSDYFSAAKVCPRPTQLDWLQEACSQGVRLLVTLESLDQQQDMFDFIKRKARSLERGGVWLNLGVLEYSFVEGGVPWDAESVREMLGAAGLEVQVWEQVVMRGRRGRNLGWTEQQGLLFKAVKL